MSARETGIVITGVGLRTAVGNNAAQTCAAVRAGMNRFGVWPWFGTTGDEEGGGGLVGAAIVPDLGDAEWTAKANLMILQPVHEAMWQAGLHDPEESARKGWTPRVYLATPYTDRFGGWSAEEGKAAYEAWLDECRNILRELVGLDSLWCFPSAHAGGFAALSRAVTELNSGEVRVALVGGVDSLLDSQLLAEYFEAGILKSETASSGLIPGEAAAFLVCETAAHAAARGARPLAAIRSISLDRESTAFGDDAPVTGEALTRALRAAVDAAGGGEGFGELMIDWTGERPRFLEWATVETRVMHAFPRGWKLSHPGDCVGDIGAAFGPFAAVLASRAFERGYSPGSGVAVCCSSPRGERSVATFFPVPS